MDQLLHLGCGMFISVVAARAEYVGPLPKEICATVPLQMQSKCMTPLADLFAQIGTVKDSYTLLIGSIKLISSVGVLDSQELPHQSTLLDQRG